ncbi:hypothetical protein LP421_27690 [Rhizobium sp. RCAM05350]|nr:hypothetical protein LP421_27690 [Rhizobium sp. RCAM05350]
MLIFVAPLIVLFLTLSSERVARESLQNTQVLMEAGVQALAKPLWDFDTDAVRADRKIAGCRCRCHVRSRQGQFQLDLRAAS